MRTFLLEPIVFSFRQTKRSSVASVASVCFVSVSAVLTAAAFDVAAGGVVDVEVSFEAQAVNIERIKNILK